MFKFVYNGVNSFTFVSSVEIYKFKAGNFERDAVPLYLDKVSIFFNQ